MSFYILLYSRSRSISGLELRTEILKGLKQGFCLQISKARVLMSIGAIEKGSEEKRDFKSAIVVFFISSGGYGAGVGAFSTTFGG